MISRFNIHRLLRPSSLLHNYNIREVHACQGIAHSHQSWIAAHKIEAYPLCSRGYAKKSRNPFPEPTKENKHFRKAPHQDEHKTKTSQQRRLHKPSIMDPHSRIYQASEQSELKLIHKKHAASNKSNAQARERAEGRLAADLLYFESIQAWQKTPWPAMDLLYLHSREGMRHWISHSNLQRRQLVEILKTKASSARLTLFAPLGDVPSHWRVGRLCTLGGMILYVSTIYPVVCVVGRALRNRLRLAEKRQ